MQKMTGLPVCRHQVCLVKTSLAVTGSKSFGIEGDAQVELGRSGPARTACWVGRQAEAFATGHEMGQVLVWMIPLDESGEHCLIRCCPSLCFNCLCRLVLSVLSCKQLQASSYFPPSPLHEPKANNRFLLFDQDACS